MALGIGLSINKLKTSSTPAFSNTYSLAFDGIDDYVDTSATPTQLGLPATTVSEGSFSISFWYNYNTITNGPPIIQSTTNYSWNDGFGIRQEISLGSNKLRFWVGNQAASAITTGNLNSSQWYHILAVFKGGATHTLEIYVDGTLDNTASFTTSRNIHNPQTISMGFAPDGFAYYYNGKLDEVAIWDTDQSSNIATLSTAPTVDLTSLNPTAWYRMGDNGSFKSPQWLIPSDENKAKLSNYSFNFPGSGKVNVGTVNVGTTNITSLWLKRDVVSTQQTLLGGSSLSSPAYHMLIFTGNQFYMRYSSTVFIGWTLSNVTTPLNDTTNWINIVVVRTGNTVKLHLNGDNVGISPNASGGGAIGALGTQFTDIGAEANGTFPTNGIINNVAAWDVDTVLPSEIYNGGTILDLTTLSTAPVNWWKMGEDATFVYNPGGTGDFTIPDQVGSNPGTSTTVPIERRVGFAPSSENNAVTINMDFVDVVLEVP